MKKNILKYVLMLTVVGSLTACDDILDQESTTYISSDAVWSSEENADQYVMASYKIFNDLNQLEHPTSRFYDACTDMIKCGDWESSGTSYNKLLLAQNYFLKGSAGIFDCWSTMYQRIRRANVLLNEIDKYGVSRYGEEWCEIRRAEVRFCRAFAYLQLVRNYGGVVIRTHESGADGLIDDGANAADVSRARASEAESYQFIIDELKWAIERLPQKWESTYFGRATKGMAYGVLCRAALYAEQWQEAIDAADNCESVGGYGLVADYAKLFDCESGQDNTLEIIYGTRYVKQTCNHSWDYYNRPYYDALLYQGTMGGLNFPTAEFADQFDWADGSTFSWDNWSSKHSDPFTDREPRFQATILYNGASWMGRKIETYVGALSSDANGTDSYTEFEKSAGSGGHTVTGYYLRKFLQENNTKLSEDGSYNTDIELRFGEILLNKAEAYAQLDYASNSAKALEAINRVRARVKLPAYTSTDAPTLDAFMTLLRKERVCELGAENLHYWDLRRWRMLEEVINGKSAHGCKITRNSAGTLTYTVSNVDAGSTRYFATRQYYMPLPTSELSNNKLCYDNPDW